MSSSVIESIIEVHAEEARFLSQQRCALVSAPNIALFRLATHDERLTAQLDGLYIAGATGLRYCESALDTLDAGAAFVYAAHAIERDRALQLQELFALTQRSADVRHGIAAAFGWVSPKYLRGMMPHFLGSMDALDRWVGFTTCSLHRVDPGLRRFPQLAEEHDAQVRARVFRIVGELGRREFLSDMDSAIGDDDVDCSNWAAWSAVLIGDRNRALERLGSLALEESPMRLRAFRLTMQAMALFDARAFLYQVARNPVEIRWLLRGTGLAGDPVYVPWLIGHMADNKLARLAGESFSMITGLDLSHPDFERPRPENFEFGPNDDPEDDDVSMDEDDGLPWPDQAKIQAWWSANGARFTTGIRHFIGAPPSREHCIDVLKNGYQRQRIAAAYHLCLLNPGTPLFEWRAPAWRQQRQLAQMK